MGEFSKFDAFLPEFFASSLDVALAGQCVALLRVLDRIGRVLQQFGGSASVKPPTLHEGGHGVVHLVYGQF